MVGLTQQILGIGFIVANWVRIFEARGKLMPLAYLLIYERLATAAPSLILMYHGAFR